MASALAKRQHFGSFLASLFLRIVPEVHVYMMELTG
jgi:hypothetical protein